MNRGSRLTILLLAASFVVAGIHVAVHDLERLHGDATQYEASDHPSTLDVEAPVAPDTEDCLVCLRAPRCRDPFASCS